ncbi:hypothetical protein HMPREF0542_10965, partial [Ligilactobacillus ruminis ATCC 25644]
AFLTEIALLVQLHFKAFLVKLRKARVQYLPFLTTFSDSQ